MKEYAPYAKTLTLYFLYYFGVACLAAVMLAMMTPHYNINI